MHVSRAAQPSLVQSHVPLTTFPWPNRHRPPSHAEYPRARCPAGSRTVNATRWPREESKQASKSEISSDAVAYPVWRRPRQDCAKNGGGMWPQCGAACCKCRIRMTNPVREARCGERPARLNAAAARNRQKLPLFRRFFVCQKVDKNAGRRLYTSSWARRRLARWRVCEAPHCSHGDRAFGHLGMAMFASPRRMCGFSVSPVSVGGRSCKVPGCLKSESEERETWTAESLRTASSNGEGLT